MKNLLSCLLLISLFIYSCGGDGIIDPVDPNNPQDQITEIKGNVVIPNNSSIDVSTLTVSSNYSVSSVASDGSYEIQFIGNTHNSNIFVTDSDGDVVFMANPVGENENFEINSTTTAKSLVMNNLSMFELSAQGQEDAQNHIESQSDFSNLVGDVENEITTNGKLFSSQDNSVITSTKSFFENTFGNLENLFCSFFQDEIPVTTELNGNSITLTNRTTLAYAIGIYDESNNLISTEYLPPAKAPFKLAFSDLLQFITTFDIDKIYDNAVFEPKIIDISNYNDGKYTIQVNNYMASIIHSSTSAEAELALEKQKEEDWKRFFWTSLDILPSVVSNSEKVFDDKCAEAVYNSFIGSTGTAMNDIYDNWDMNNDAGMNILELMSNITALGKTYIADNIHTWAECTGEPSIWTKTLDDRLKALEALSLAGTSMNISVNAAERNCQDYSLNYCFKIISGNSIICDAVPFTINWEKTYGGSLEETVRNGIITSDGGLLVIGTSKSADGDLTGHGVLTGDENYWILKLDAIGNIEWQKQLAGNERDIAYDVIEPVLGEFYVVGVSSSQDMDFQGGSLGRTWITKLGATGNLIWSNDYSTDGALSIVGQTNGVLIGGVADTWNSTPDFKVEFIDFGGNNLWSQSYQGTSSNSWSKIIDIATTNNGFFLAGVQGNNINNQALSDVRVVKIDQSGNKIWDNTFGGSGGDVVNEIYSTNDGGAVILCTTNSNDGDISINFGGKDFWILKIDANGNKEWEKSLGSNEDEEGETILQTASGNYVVAGTRTVGSFLQGWIVELDGSQNIVNERPFDNSTQIKKILTTNTKYNTLGRKFIPNKSEEFWITELQF